jgi:hypothetical protein
MLQGSIRQMLEITPDDIASRSDEQLCEAVGRICAAELRARGPRAASATWGGDHNAADGGIDVRVSLPERSSIDGCVPRPSTGFQVKAQDKPAREKNR